MRLQLRPRPLTTIALFVLGLYLSVYLLLSSWGQYDDDTLVMDKVVGATCICSSRFMVWQPLYISWATFSETLYANTRGYVFSPLILIDQKLWHPNMLIESRAKTQEEIDEWIKARDERHRREEEAKGGVP